MNTVLRPPKILDEEITWDKSQVIVSKTDLFGTILYANDAFSNTSEYSKLEIVGEPHNVIRHPDMPKVIFKVLWQHLKEGKNFHAIIKNLTKSGRYYWVITDFTIDTNDAGEIAGYTARRKAVPDSVVTKIAPLYKTLLEIEQQKNEKASELYFNAYLKEETGKNYNDFILHLFNEELKKQETIVETPKEKNTVLQKGLNWFFHGTFDV